jgi:hypothetical protein
MGRLITGDQDPLTAGLAFPTVTVTGAEVTVPAALRARAVSVWDPSATVLVFQFTEYGAVVSSAPMLLPSTRN